MKKYLVKCTFGRGNTSFRKFFEAESKAKAEILMSEYSPYHYSRANKVIVKEVAI